MVPILESPCSILFEKEIQNYKDLRTQKVTIIALFLGRNAQQMKVIIIMRVSSNFFRN